MSNQYLRRGVVLILDVAERGVLAGGGLGPGGEQARLHRRGLDLGLGLGLRLVGLGEAEGVVAAATTRGVLHPVGLQQRLREER